MTMKKEKSTHNIPHEYYDRNNIITKAVMTKDYYESSILRDKVVRLYKKNHRTQRYYE